MARWANAMQTRDEVYRLKREAVLRESGRIFSRRGFHNTSLSDIAKHLDVSKGTLYNYIQDKQEILYEFHLMALRIGQEAIDDAATREGSGAAKFRAAMFRFLANVNRELGGYGVITEVGALKPEHRKDVIRLRDDLDRRLTGLIEIGLRDGSLRKLDPKMAIFTFMGALQTVPNWFSPEGRLSADEVAGQVTDLLMSGIATPAHRDRSTAELAAQA